MKNHEAKIFCLSSNTYVQTQHVIIHQPPDIVILEQKEKNALLIDIAIPGE